MPLVFILQPLLHQLIKHSGSKLAHKQVVLLAASGSGVSRHSHDTLLTALINSWWDSD